MKIFILEDDPDRIRWFHDRFINHDCTIIQTCEREYEFKPPYDLILLDHDLGGRQMAEHEDCGLTFIRMIKDRIDNTPIIVHSYNPDGAKRMCQEVDGAIHLPFRGQNFNNVLDRFVSDGK